MHLQLRELCSTMRKLKKRLIHQDFFLVSMIVQKPRDAATREKTAQQIALAAIAFLSGGPDDINLPKQKWLTFAYLIVAFIYSK